MEDLGRRAKFTSLSPWEKRGEMDQGILRMASYSLYRVAEGYSCWLYLIGTPLGFLLGNSPLLTQQDVRSRDSEFFGPYRRSLGCRWDWCSFVNRNQRLYSPSRSVPCGRR